MTMYVCKISVLIIAKYLAAKLLKIRRKILRKSGIQAS